MKLRLAPLLLLLVVAHTASGLPPRGGRVLAAASWGAAVPTVTQPCEWAVDQPVPACDYNEYKVFSKIVPYKKVTKFEAQIFYNWTIFQEQAVSCYTKYKTQAACEADLKTSCCWYDQGGNRFEETKPSCDVHPNVGDYSVWLNYKFACPKARGILDFQCSLRNTKAQCTALKGCLWDPARPFPCGVSPAGLTPTAKALLPSFLALNSSTTVLKDFQAVWGVCPRSTTAFRQQLCYALPNAATCAKPVYAKDCAWDAAALACTPRNTLWWVEGLGNDPVVTKVFKELEAACKPLKTAALCAKYSYTNIAWLK